MFSQKVGQSRAQKQLEGLFRVGKDSDLKTQNDAELAMINGGEGLGLIGDFGGRGSLLGGKLRTSFSYDIEIGRL